MRLSTEYSKAWIFENDRGKEDVVLITNMKRVKTNKVIILKTLDHGERKKQNVLVNDIYVE